MYLNVECCMIIVCMYSSNINSRYTYHVVSKIMLKSLSIKSIGEINKFILVLHVPWWIVYVFQLYRQPPHMSSKKNYAEINLNKTGSQSCIASFEIKWIGRCRNHMSPLFSEIELRAGEHSLKVDAQFDVRIT